MRRLLPVLVLLSGAGVALVGLPRESNAEREAQQRADTIVASDLAGAGGASYAGRRVLISGDLVRLGSYEIDEDFGVADPTGIAVLEFDQELIQRAELLDALLEAHHVEVVGVVEVGRGHPSDAPGPRILVDRRENLVLHEEPPFRAIVLLFGLLLLALLIGHLATRKRLAERRALEIAEFTEVLNRRDEILRAVSYAAQRFLREPAWEKSLPDALERLGRAASVTRASVYTISRAGGAPVIDHRCEWVESGIATALGDLANSNLDLGQLRLPRWRECFLRNEVVMGTVSTLPEEERIYLEERRVRSIIVIPVQVSGALGGLLLLTDHLTEREWPSTERKALLIAAGTIGAAVERRNVELALADVEDRFRQMAEHIREVFFMTDARTHEVLYLSPAYEEVWGRSRQETIDEPLAFVESILPEDRHLMLQNVRLSETGSGPRERQFEYRIRRPDGAIRWIRNRSVQVYGGDGGPHRVVGVCTDITEQRQLEEELRRAHRIEAIGHLAAGIAHEINTPIQYVGGNLEFLDESFRDIRNALETYGRLLEEARQGEVCAERLEQFAAEIKGTDLEFILAEAPKASEQALDGVRRVSEIVRAMKEFSHPGTGQRVLTDLNHAIRSTSTVARSEWKYVAELVTELDPELPMVPCLRGELNQAILNLIVNAAHAIADRQKLEMTHQPGTITISTAAVGESVEIRVSDTGTGIAEEIRPRIFDPFFTTKEVGRGTGQGLTFVHSIVVDQHGGTVTFDTAPGVGTTFVIRLPVRLKAADLSEAA